MSMSVVEKDEIFLTYVLSEGGRAVEALKAVKDLAAVREQVQHGVERREEQRVWNEIRMALHFAANVPRVFFPTGGASATAKTRCQHMRDLVGISAGHPIEQRGLRNHVEHFDERLDDWTTPSPRPFLTYELVRQPDIPTLPDTWDAVCMIYDAAAHEVRILGESFSLLELESTIADVQKRTSETLLAYLKARVHPKPSA